MKKTALICAALLGASCGTARAGDWSVTADNSTGFATGTLPAGDANPYHNYSTAHYPQSTEAYLSVNVPGQVQFTAPRVIAAVLRRRVYQWVPANGNDPAPAAWVTHTATYLGRLDAKVYGQPQAGNNPSATAQIQFTANLNGIAHS